MPDGRAPRRHGFREQARVFAPMHALWTAALCALPAALVAANWLRLEHPRQSTRDAVLIALLGLVPALVRPTWLRAPVLVAVTLAALNVAFGGRAPGGFPAAIADGALRFYDVAVPFRPELQPLMHGVTLIAIFAFCLAIGLTTAARMPLAAGGLLLVGAAWPATLQPSGDELRQGALVLAALLALLLGSRPRVSRAVRPAVVVGAVALAAGLVASSSPAIARGALLDWKRWDLYTKGERVMVRYVWDSNYDGIRFPKRRTPVLTVRAPARPLYWRATTLDAFSGYGWVEVVIFEAAERRRGADDLSLDPLVPARVRNARWIEQEVTVEGLLDRHLVGASVPVAFDPDEVGPITYARGAIAYASRDLVRDERYRVWSFAARPTPAQLARSQPRYGSAIHEGEFLSIAPGVGVPPFGAPARERVLRDLLRSDSYDERVAPYAPLYAAARRVVGRPRNPYAAVVALESWFRAAGGFVYDEQPPRAGARPPLVDFVTRTKRGYCQHFAGAMALMLRYLGIPARVAAGFTSGSYDAEDGAWTVTDHNAHTWVEVWFRGYGWLPFDPTPGRGGLSGSYTVASPNFDSPGAAQVAVGAAAAAIAALRRLGQSNEEGGGEGGTAPVQGEGLASGALEEPAGGSRQVWPLALLLLGVVGILWLAKLGLRRSRYLTRDPRRTAAACRRELIDFLSDQGAATPRSATLAELGALAEARLAVSADAFVARASAARFGSPEEAPAAALESRRELRALLRLARRRLSFVERLRGLLSLRSLGFRASS